MPVSTRKPRIFLLIPCFVPYDAVGNDVLGMYRLLRAASYEVYIFAAELHRSYQDIAQPLALEADQYWQCPGDILIYHHAIGWPLGEAVLARSRNKIVIKYHNITPAHFFQGYAQHYYQACIEGERASRRLARLTTATFWGDSDFNSEELISYGAPRENCRSLPPCHLIENLHQVPLDLPILHQYRDGLLNLLFVGGIKPNKGHFRALQAFAAYRQAYDRRARLIFAGSFDPGLASYANAIRTVARKLGVQCDTVFAYSVSSSQLRSLYYVADIFLCASEHEGFCVPLIEAMSFRVPIIAWGTTAVPETVREAGLVHMEFDVLEFAASIARCAEDLGLNRDLAGRGRLRYETVFHPDAIQRKLLRFIDEIGGNCDA